MKGNYYYLQKIFLVLLGTIFSISLLRAQSEVKKELIAILTKDESLVYGDECAFIGTSDGSLSFVTMVFDQQNNIEYYHYHHGGKEGPFRDTDPAWWSKCNESVLSDCASYESPLPTKLERYIDEKTGCVVFKGRKYGPFLQVLYLVVAPRDKAFYCIALTPGMDMYFFDSQNRVIPVTGVIDGMYLSPDGNSAFVKMVGDYNPYDLEAMYNSNIVKARERNMGVYLIGIDSTTYGPFDHRQLYDVWFTRNNKFAFRLNSDVYLDGKILLQVPERASTCDIIISDDATQYAIIDGENIKFQDGSAFPAPIAFGVYKKDGTGMIRWIIQEEGKKIMSYTREF